VFHDDDITIEIWTDGSCLGNPGPGGWAFVITDGYRTHEESGCEDATTNNRMEIMAAIKAFQFLSGNTNIRAVVYSDSLLLVNTMSHGWKKRTNVDLWEELDRLVEHRHISWKWVKGHAGLAQNERCNALAQKAIMRTNLRIPPLPVK
jgi:ribonuclease HI